ncbi:MAG TPA: 3-oxoacyl-ACP reductase FabG [Smithella sp.]|jgi:3-oxoacyl-[acyl-carrier protein] reductase|nr:3-oxoacyl-ACP reductase FabG [Smithella sp.]HOG09742.1 3-oxoacyl-ACP reductase FabG [Smithella sp.]HOO35992.1 3-oxoacyl-ACP reductase FabG [Smithella sp.]HOS14505.1 3-oxoacyl-ACP reductase FabG [Smithella sp.]HOX98999.1 3-oxoacyl-ACP reductase FabG [Smithella sp.]
MNDKKTAIITGASRGIGRATAVQLARAGYFVIINFKTNETAAQETLNMVKSEGGDGTIIPFDVADSEQTRNAVKTITEQYKNIQALINNAGITADGLFMLLGEEEWDSVINTSLNGFYHMTKPILREMIRKKRGSIVSVSSLSALMPNRGQANYAAAKAGIIAASRSLASEVARFGVRVNVVAPGLIETDMIKDAPVDQIKQIIPMARLGKPQEVASVIRFLCSDDASYVTGQVIGINGGIC